MASIIESLPCRREIIRIRHTYVYVAYTHSRTAVDIMVSAMASEAAGGRPGTRPDPPLGVGCSSPSAASTSNAGPRIRSYGIKTLAYVRCREWFRDSEGSQQGGICSSQTA